MTNAQVAQACSILLDERSAAQLNADSSPVARDRQCRMINGGVFDTIALGRASALGDGRFQQVVDGPHAYGFDKPNLIYVADCNTREATIIVAPSTPIDPETSCGPYVEYDEVTGPHAFMSMAQGDTLHELVDFASALGAAEENPLSYFFAFTAAPDWDTYEVTAKDRFDLMCGCKLFYPLSEGAK